MAVYVYKFMNNYFLIESCEAIDWHLLLKVLDRLSDFVTYF